MILVTDAYEHTLRLIAASQIAEVQAVYGKTHNAAIRQIGVEGWLRVKETAQDIERQMMEQMEK